MFRAVSGFPAAKDFPFQRAKMSDLQKLYARVLIDMPRRNEFFRSGPGFAFTLPVRAFFVSVPAHTDPILPLNPFDPLF